MMGWQLPDGSVYYRQTDLIKILASYGVVMGLYFRPGDVEKGERVVKDLRLTLDVPIKGMVCVIGVKSKTQTLADHCVFFDGENVLDPQHDEPQSITDYRILDIYPLLYFIDKPWDKDEKPVAPPVEDLVAVARCLEDNPSWDNILCGKYGRILAQHYLRSHRYWKNIQIPVEFAQWGMTKETYEKFLKDPSSLTNEPLSYDKLVQQLKDAGITMDRGSIHIEAPVPVSHLTVEQVREYFWRTHPQFDRNLKIHDYGRPTFPTDVRSAWVDYIYRMVEENKITQETADHITLVDQDTTHSNVIEIILHKVQYTFTIPLDIELDDILREEIDESVYEEIKDQILNGFKSGKLTHYEGEKTIEGEWQIIGE